GEAHIRGSSWEGKGEDRSVYDGNNGNQFHRFAGVNTSAKNPNLADPANPNPHPIIAVKFAEHVAPYPTANASFGSWHPGACQNNLKQIGLAVHNFHDTYRELPPWRYADNWPSFWVLILPYIEQGNVSKLWDVKLRYYEQTDAARMNNIRTYFCPARRSPPTV